MTSTTNAADQLRDLDPRLKSQNPDAWIVLGSGLGGLADAIEDAVEIPYGEISGWVRSTAGGHRGRLILGSLAGHYIAAMAGRFHFYEGWTLEQVTAPIRLAAKLKCPRLIASNAAGGLSPKLAVGDLMLIEDHINWIGLPARSGDTSPARRGGKTKPFYDSSMGQAARQAAINAGFSLHRGTYLATKGPTYETRAEYRMMRKLGADAVGMSTVPEVMVAKDHNMRVMAISMISNVADPDRPNVANHEEVLAAGREAATRMESVVRGVVAECGNDLDAGSQPGKTT